MTKELTKFSKFSVVEFDRLLSEDCVKPTHIIVHPMVYNGHWGRVKGKTKWFWGLKSTKMFRK